jgi:hypothetical protein
MNGVVDLTIIPCKGIIVCCKVKEEPSPIGGMRVRGLICVQGVESRSS